MQRILHLVLSIGETNATYNEHCLPRMNTRAITICTYFNSGVVPPDQIRLFAGDGTVGGFIRALRATLQAGPYDVIHAHSPHVALFLLMVAPGLGSSAVVTVHDSYQDYTLRNRLFFLPVFARFGAVVCCGRASFDSFPVAYRRLAGDRLRAVQNGMDIARVDRIAAGVPLATRNGHFGVVAVSRLVDVKNPFTVLGAFRHSTNETGRLTYIGDGPLRESLAANGAGLDRRIAFTGLLPRETVFEHLLNADLFVSASRGEGLPIAVLEAMACRCPVVLSDIPPHREIVGGADFIPLINPDDEEGFARAIRTFMEMPRSVRQSIGDACRRLVEERFSLDAMHAGYEDVYASVGARRGAAATAYSS